MARVKLITKSKKASSKGAERRRAAAMAPRMEAPTDGGIKLPEPQTIEDDILPNPLAIARLHVMRARLLSRKRESRKRHQWSRLPRNLRPKTVAS